MVPFQMVESRDADGRVRLLLTGELDLLMSDMVSARFEQLARDRALVRVDLSNLNFIDSSGITALVAAVHDGERRVEVMPDCRSAVSSAFELAGVREVLWPTTDSPV